MCYAKINQKNDIVVILIQYKLPFIARNTTRNEEGFFTKQKLIKLRRKTDKCTILEPSKSLSSVINKVGEKIIENVGDFNI